MIKKIRKIYPEESAQIAALQEEKEKLKGEVDADNEAKIVEVVAKLKEVGKKIPRISANAPIILACAIDYGLNELLECARQLAKKEEKATIRHDHLVEPEIEELPTFPFWAPLPTYRAIDAAKTSLDEEDGTPHQFLTYVSKILDRIKERVRAEAGEEPEPEPEPEAAEEGEEGEEKKKVKEPFRVSRMLKATCSNMVEELVEIVTEQAAIMAVSVKQVRTISAEHVIHSCESLLTTYGRDRDHIKDFSQYIHEKLTSFSEHRKTEAEKQKGPEKELTEEEKAAKEGKALEKAKERFVKSLLAFNDYLQAHGQPLSVISDIIKEQLGGKAGKGKKK